MLSLSRLHLSWSMLKCLLNEQTRFSSTCVASALRSRKAKSARSTPQHFIDTKVVKTIGGNGGDGNISFLSLRNNEFAGPDGGDGGNGGHVVFQASKDVKDLSFLVPILQGEQGEKGHNKDCHGRNADHLIVQVPVGTIVRKACGKIIGDLKHDNTMFVAARGGAGGRGNHYFATDTLQSPNIAEYGGKGEDFRYILEVCSMADVGLIGFPNAGKSTLLRAISRARPKVACYPFTTLKPHIGVVQYDDYEQVAVADLPGLIPGSHKNRGLGIEFLKHAERCFALMFMVDLSCDEPWTQFDILCFELNQFNTDLTKRPQLIVGNKIDLPEAQENLPLLQKHVTLPVLPVSAKTGINLSVLLQHIRRLYDEKLEQNKEDDF